MDPARAQGHRHHDPYVKSDATQAWTLSVRSGRWRVAWNALAPVWVPMLVYSQVMWACGLCGSGGGMREERTYLAHATCQEEVHFSDTMPGTQVVKLMVSGEHITLHAVLTSY